MSLLGFGGSQQSSAQKIAAAELELEMITDLFSRLQRSCMQKCIPIDYREGELNKGESVCLDRCVGKFFEVTIKVSEGMQRKQQAAMGASGSAAPGGFGFGQ